jgi:hypothetical protein
VNKENIHLILLASLFSLFFLGAVFVKTWYLSGLIIPLVVLNHFIMLSRRKGGHFLNTLILTCSFLLFFVVIEYLATILGCIFSLILFFKFFFSSPVKKKKTNKKIDSF